MPRLLRLAVNLPDPFAAFLISRLSYSRVAAWIRTISGCRLPGMRVRFYSRAPRYGSSLHGKRRRPGDRSSSGCSAGGGGDVDKPGDGTVVEADLPVMRLARRPLLKYASLFTQKVSSCAPVSQPGQSQSSFETTKASEAQAFGYRVADAKNHVRECTFSKVIIKGDIGWLLSNQ
jgi:hypothetical protein